MISSQRVSGNLYLELSRCNQTNQAELWPLAIISYWSAGKLSSIIIPSSWPPKIINNYKFSAKFRHCLFIMSSCPNVPETCVPASHALESPSPIPASPSPTSLSPMFWRSRVLVSQVPRPRPTISHSLAKWNQTKPNETKPNETKPNEMKPSETKQSEMKPNHF